MGPMLEHRARPRQLPADPTGRGFAGASIRSRRLERAGANPRRCRHFARTRFFRGLIEFEAGRSPMPIHPSPVQHQDVAQKSDEILEREARAHLAGAPALQLVAGLLITLRSLEPAWWGPAELRRTWGA